MQTIIKVFNAVAATQHAVLLLNPNLSGRSEPVQL